MLYMNNIWFKGLKCNQINDLLWVGIFQMGSQERFMKPINMSKHEYYICICSFLWVL